MPSEPSNWSEHPDFVDFYLQHRNRAEDLYLSEQRFLPWLAGQAESVLDAGCAAGGFSNIWRHYQPQITYTGLDLSHALIAAAQQLYPDLKFSQSNIAQGTTLPDQYATVVQALGWLHWESSYEDALEELWRLTSRYLFFDLRLVNNSVDAMTGQQRFIFKEEWDGKTTTPYITVLWATLANFLLELRPKRILGYGYWGKPSESVFGIDQAVCFATFVLEKEPSVEKEKPTICLDMPLTWPDELLDQVSLLPSLHLDSQMALE